jgi:hypothetical protein
VLSNLVWDRLHGRFRPAPPRDIDLAFFDPTRLDPARDAEVEAALARRLPDIPWDAKDQAAVHTWYDRVFGPQVPPLRSATDGSPSWPETATASGRAPITRAGHPSPPAGSVALTAPVSRRPHRPVERAALTHGGPRMQRTMQADEGGRR